MSIMVTNIEEVGATHLVFNMVMNVVVADLITTKQHVCKS